MYVLLLVAIVFEVAGTTSMRLSDGFTRTWPTLAVFACYGVAFYMMSLTLRQLPLSITYAIWSGLGTAGTALIGVWLFREQLDWPKVAGIALVVAGVVLLNVKAPAAG